MTNAMTRFGPPDTKPGNYYVTARRDDGKAVILAGPFRDDHKAAIEMVREATRIANDVDPRAPWYSYGTMRATYDYEKPGVLNDRLGLTT